MDAVKLKQQLDVFPIKRLTQDSQLLVRVHAPLIVEVDAAQVKRPQRLLRKEFCSKLADN